MARQGLLCRNWTASETLSLCARAGWQQSFLSSCSQATSSSRIQGQQTFPQSAPIQLWLELEWRHVPISWHGTFSTCTYSSSESIPPLVLFDNAHILCCSLPSFQSWTPTSRWWKVRWPYSQPSFACLPPRAVWRLECDTLLRRRLGPWRQYLWQTKIINIL